MAKTSGELEKEFIETAKNKTGRSLEQWLALVKTSGVGKRNDIIEWLKKGHGLNHMQAQFVAGIHFNNGNPVYINENALLENQFEKCPNMRPLFGAVAENIITTFPGTQLIPKKTYLSFTAVREFAAMNIKPNEIRLGMDLGERQFDEAVQKSKLTGPMPRITHMVIITDSKQLDKKLEELLQESYNRSHKK
jgi:hypothetical protein